MSILRSYQPHIHLLAAMSRLGADMLEEVGRLRETRAIRARDLADLRSMLNRVRTALDAFELAGSAELTFTEYYALAGAGDAACGEL